MAKFLSDNIGKENVTDNIDKENVITYSKFLNWSLKVFSFLLKVIAQKPFPNWSGP